MLRQTHPPTGSPWRAAAALGLLLILAAPAARGAPRLRAEIGPVYEFTNLIYRASDRTYLGNVCDDGTMNDSCFGNAIFSDSLVISSTPQSAGGSMLRLTFSDTLNSDRYYWLQPELSVQQQLFTAHLYGTWRWAFGRTGIAGLTQRFEHTLDHRFGYTRRIDTEALAGSIGYRSEDLAWAVDFRPSAQLDRTNGSTALYIQDSNSGRIAATASHFSTAGRMVDAEVYWGARGYPDSALRNYREASALVRLSQPFAGGLHGMLAANLERRSGPYADQRNDLYTRWAGEADLGWLGLEWGLRAHGLAEHTGYARPSAVFFDSRLLRADVSGTRSLGRSWELELRPRLETLATPVASGEAYRQASLSLDATRAAGGILDLTLETGRRNYTDPAGVASSDTASLYVSHSDYHFYTVSALVTQPLLSGLSLRGAFDFTTEVHDLAEDNNHVLYLNTEISYSFWLFGR